MPSSGLAWVGHHSPCPFNDASSGDAPRSQAWGCRRRGRSLWPLYYPPHRGQLAAAALARSKALPSSCGHRGRVCWTGPRLLALGTDGSHCSRLFRKKNKPARPADPFLSPVYFRPISLCLKPVSCGLRSSEGLAGGLGLFLPVRWAGPECCFPRLDFSPSLRHHGFPGFGVSWVHREGADGEGDSTGRDPEVPPPRSWALGQCRARAGGAKAIPQGQLRVRPPGLQEFTEVLGAETSPGGALLCLHPSQSPHFTDKTTTGRVTC